MNSRILSLPLALMVVTLAACSSEHQQPPAPVAGNHAEQQQQLEAVSHDDAGSAGSAVVVDLNAATGVDALIPKLLPRRLISVGESHTAYGHHLNQLEIIRRLHAEYPDIVIGMEMFQQPYQAQLDAYIAGDLDERQLLEQSGWYERWGYDYRLYRPLLEFAQQNRIPVVALNISTEIKERVSEVGLEGLSEEERLQIPSEIDRSDKVYEQRLKTIYEQHPQLKKEDFERFLDVQLLWDESMASQAATWLQDHPQQKMILLAGSGHLLYGSGIPDRVVRRISIDSATVLPADGLEISREVADYVIYPPKATLPVAGLMGLFLENVDHGVKISEIGDNSNAATAGVKQGDVIRVLNGRRISSISAIKIELLDKPPGEKITLEVSREGLLWGEDLLEFSFELGQ